MLKLYCFCYGEQQCLEQTVSEHVEFAYLLYVLWSSYADFVVHSGSRPNVPGSNHVWCRQRASPYSGTCSPG